MSVSTEGFLVIGPMDLIVVVLGRDIILPCRVSLVMSVENMEMRWFHFKFSEAVFIYQNCQKQKEELMAQYAGRTSLEREHLMQERLPCASTRSRLLTMGCIPASSEREASMKRPV